MSIIKKKTKNKHNHSRKKHLIFGIIAGCIFSVIFLVYLGINNIKSNSITSFQECSAAGFEIMESYPRQCNAYGKNFVEVIEENDLENEILQIDKGEGGGNLLMKRGNYIINSSEEWNRIFGNSGIDPDIDFNEKTVIAIVMGQKTSGGYSVTLKQLEVEEGEIKFMVEEAVPGENCLVTQALTNPYQIVAIGKTQKSISFVGSTIIDDCSK